MSALRKKLTVAIVTATLFCAIRYFMRSLEADWFGFSLIGFDYGDIWLTAGCAFFIGTGWDGW